MGRSSISRSWSTGRSVGVFVAVLAFAGCGPAGNRWPGAPEAVRVAHELADEGDTCGALAVLYDADRAIQAAVDDIQAEEQPDWHAVNCWVKARVREWIEEARLGHPATLTIDLESTCNYGCICPPFAFGDSADGASFSEELLYVISVPGVREMPAYTCPTASFRVTGRFTGQEIDRYEWAAARGADPPVAYEDDEGAFDEKHPLFEVTSWCVTWVREGFPLEDACEEADDQGEEGADVEECEEWEDPAAAEERAWREVGLTFADACPEFQRIE